MDRKTKITRSLALLGTTLVWFPIAALVFTTTVGSIQTRTFIMDFLMPAELFFLVLIGGGLLIWAAFRSNNLKLPIILTLSLGITMVIGGQGLAMLTGLADGRVGMESGWFTVLAVMLGVYSLTVILLGIWGVRLLAEIKRLDKS